MYKKIVSCLIAPALLLLSPAVNATLIKETWQSTVTSTDHSVFSAGDTFQWMATYDSASQRMLSFWDGANGIAEQGGGDDLFGTATCTTSYSGPDICTHFHPPQYTFAADVIFDISDFYDPMQAAGKTGANHYTNNRAQRYGVGNTPTQGALYRIDDLDFQLGGLLYTYYDGGFTTTFFRSQLISTERVGVPEPAVVALMSIGLVGMGVARARTTSTSNRTKRIN